MAEEVPPGTIIQHRTTGHIAQVTSKLGNDDQQEMVLLRNDEVGMEIGDVTRFMPKNAIILWPYELPLCPRCEENPIKYGSLDYLCEKCRYG